jgi:hypothetical protein
MFLWYLQTFLIKTKVNLLIEQHVPAQKTGVTNVRPKEKVQKDKQ